MSALHLTALDTSPLSEKVSLISSMISETYASSWCARALSAEHDAMSVDGTTGDGVTIARANLLPLSLINQPRQTNRPDKFYAYYTNQISTVKVEGADPVCLQPNELMILNSKLPCELVISRAYTTSALVIDGDLFRQFVPDHLGLLARRLHYSYNLANVLSGVIDSAWSISNAGKFEEAAPKLIRSFLDLLSLVTKEDARPSEEDPSSSVLDIRREQVKSFVDRNYMVPEMSVGMIARELQLSPRYLQLAFSGDEMTPLAYIRHKRLEACARLLRERAWRNRSITQISFSCGFNSSAHFSSEFKRVYGVSPRDYRATEGAVC